MAISMDKEFMNIREGATNVEREMGIVLTQLEYLRNDVKLAQEEIRISLKERSDLWHTLDDIQKGFGGLQKDIERLSNSIQELTRNLESHVKSDIGISDFFAGKVGKFIIVAVTAAFSVVIVEYIRSIIKRISGL